MVDELEVMLRLETGKPFRLVAEREEAGVSGGFGGREGSEGAADAEALDLSVDVFFEVGCCEEDVEERVGWGARVCRGVTAGACGFSCACFSVVGVHVS